VDRLAHHGRLEFARPIDKGGHADAALVEASLTAFAFDYGTFDGSDVTFTLSDGSTTTLGSTRSNYSTPDFFGVIDTTGLSSVQLTAAGADDTLNVNGVVVPEPT
jgi:hypothetical protein